MPDWWYVVQRPEKPNHSRHNRNIAHTAKTSSDKPLACSNVQWPACSFSFWKRISRPFVQLFSSAGIGTAARHVPRDRRTPVPNLNPSPVFLTRVETLLCPRTEGPKWRADDGSRGIS